MPSRPGSLPRVDCQLPPGQTPGLGPINAAIASIFPARRIVGLPVPGAIRYLWHENSWWEEAFAAAAEIDRTIPTDGTL